jgi:hypothetical protein
MWAERHAASSPLFFFVVVKLESIIVRLPKRSKKTAALLLGLLSGVPGIRAQNSEKQRPVCFATRVDEAPMIDGNLDDPVLIVKFTYLLRL